MKKVPPPPSRRPPAGRAGSAPLLFWSLAACLASVWLCADHLLGDAWSAFLFYDIFPASEQSLFDMQEPVTVTVPELVGTTFSADELPDLFEPDVTYQYSDTPARIILAQTPDGGTRRKAVPGSRRVPLSLTVSIGPRTTPVPDVSGLDARKAGISLSERGLRVRAVELFPVRPGLLADADGIRFRYVPRGTVRGISGALPPTGSALFTDPPAGSRLPDGDMITLYVLAREAVPSPVCPQVCGLTRAEAVRALGERGIRVGSITVSPDDPTPAGPESDARPGTVTSQSRLPGTRLSPDDSVDLTLAPAPAAPLPPSDFRHFWQRLSPKL